MPCVSRKMARQTLNIILDWLRFTALSGLTMLDNYSLGSHISPREAHFHDRSISGLLYQNNNLSEEKVTFVGSCDHSSGKSLSPECTVAIQTFQSLSLKSDVVFLRMCSFCRSFSLNYAAHEAPLAAIRHGRGLTAHGKVTRPDAQLLMLFQWSCLK